MFRVIKKALLAIAPIAPFVSEYIYQNFIRKFGRGEESVFFERYPEFEEKWVDEELERDMEIVRDISEASYNARQKAGIKLRWPLRKLIVEGGEDVRRAVENLEEIIKNQCNVKEVEYVQEFQKAVVAKPNYRKLGPLLKDRVKSFAEFVNSMGQDELKKVVEDGKVEFDGIELDVNEVLEIEYHAGDEYSVAEFGKGAVYLTTSLDEGLMREAFAREIVRRIQEMRKEMNLDVDEFIKTTADFSQSEVEGWIEYIKEETRSKEIIFGEPSGYIREWDIDGRKIRIGIERYEA